MTAELITRAGRSMAEVAAAHRAMNEAIRTATDRVSQIPTNSPHLVPADRTDDSGDAPQATPRRAKRPKREKDNLEYQGMMRRLLRAYGKRVKAEDPSTLGELMALRGELDAVINSCARSLHDDGRWSWGEIGAEVGLTRNAAWKRWGQDGAE